MKKNIGKHTYFFPLPVLIIGSYDEFGIPNAMNAAWGTVCDYNMVQVFLTSSHKTSYNIKHSQAFTIAFADANHVKEADYFGIASGNDANDKIAKAHLTTTPSTFVNAPIINEFPLTLECKLKDYIVSGGDLTITGTIENICVEEKYLDEKGNIDVEKLNLISYNPANNTYISLGKEVDKAFKCGKELNK